MKFSTHPSWASTCQISLSEKDPGGWEGQGALQDSLCSRCRGAVIVPLCLLSPWRQSVKKQLYLDEAAFKWKESFLGGRDGKKLWAAK